MTGLRHRKKAESRQRMLDTAKDLFIQNGYNRTTMDEIAERAVVGVATVYNYFQTKEGLFATMAREDMALIKQRGEDSLSQCSPHPITAVYDLVLIYNGVFDFISYGLMQEFQTQSKTEGPLAEVSEWVYAWQQDQVTRALENCKSQGSINDRLNCALAAQIVIDQLIRHSQRLVRHSQRLDHGSTSRPDVSHMESVLELVLEGWCTPDPI